MSWVGDLILQFHNWKNGVSKVKTTLKKNTDPLRIGVLAAAAINFAVIIDTTATHPDTVLVGIAARSKSSAEAQIAKHNLGSTCRAYDGYDSLLADPNIDIVYIPTPNGLHAVWAIKAMEAGKHVLIEKPISSNADEARQIQETAQRTGKVALEAYHWRFHPAAHLCREIITSGKYGAVTDVRALFYLFKGMWPENDIRWSYSLGGGASMDLCYIFSACQVMCGLDPLKADVRVLEATPRLRSSDNRIDEAMDAKFVIEESGSGKKPVNCHVQCDPELPPFLGFIPRLWDVKQDLQITLEKAVIDFTGFVLLAYGHAITIREKDANGKLTGKTHVEKLFVDGPQWGTRGKPWWTTYRYQLEAMVDMVRSKENGSEYHGPWMDLEESKKLMQIIDQVYEKAGLPKRGVPE